MSELDDHAARGRARREKEKAKSAARPWWRWSSRPKPVLMAEHALAVGIDGRLVVAFLLAAGAVVGILFGLMAVAQTPIPELAACGFGLLSFLPLAVLVRNSRIQLAARELARLRALPFTAEWEAYRVALGKQRMSTVVTVRARFHTALDPAQARRIGDVAHGLIKRGKARCTSDQLVIESHKLTSYSLGTSDSDGGHSNHLVHAWVRKTLDALTKIHTEHRIASLELVVE